jgi:hypothetical protein
MLRRLLPLLGVNLVPLGGVFLAGWSPATAFTLYWCENLIGSVLVAARIAIHRAATGKRGHRRLQLGLQSQGELQVAGKRKKWRHEGGQAGSFLVEFLLFAGAGTAVHGLLLWALLRNLLESGPVADDLRNGVLAVAGFQLAGFLADLVGIRERPFAWIRELAQLTANRVTLIHLALITGFWFGVDKGGLSSFFGPFAALKAMADVGAVLARLGVRADGDEAPGWLTASMNRLRTDQGDFGEYWRQRREHERQLRAEDEETAR